MILSRFWYVVLAFAVGASVFLLFVASALYNRTGQRAMAEALSADSSAVSWFLKDDARNRSSSLIPMALDPEIRAGLSKTSTEDKPSREVAEKTRVALRRLGEAVDPELQFDGLFAVDATGRVIATVGDAVAASEDWDMGGYAVVADALHGWIRDDAWIWKGRILRVVARPVEQEVNAEPVGAVVGVKIVDDKFAQMVSKRTGAAVGFYAEGARVASWAPEGFDKANLDVITQDLKALEGNADYREKGRSEPRVINAHLGVVYARLYGEAWDLGAGFAVGRLAAAVDSPFDFLEKANDDDKKQVPTAILVGAVLLLAVVGLGLSLLEHTKPLAIFEKEAARFARGEVDTMQPSKFGGAFRKIASDLNDGVEKVVVKGGGSKRAADLEEVLGPIPAKPSMSAFSVPGAPGTEPEPRPAKPKAAPKPAEKQRPVAPAPPSAAPPTVPLVTPPEEEARGSIPIEQPRGSIPMAVDSQPMIEPEPEEAPHEKAKPPPRPKAAEKFDKTLASADPNEEPNPQEELREWHGVYEEFLSLKKQCGEATSSLTFEKFKGTLERNKAALVARHNCTRVKFTVYVKDGKAALKASPIK